MYSYITGIPLSEILKVKLQRATFTDTYFNNDVKLNVSEAELKLIESEVDSVKGRINTEESRKNIDEGELLPKSFIKPISDPCTPICQHFEDIPIDFYDNDDGFWDDYIKEKHGYFDVKNLHYRPFEVYSDMLKRKDI